MIEIIGTELNQWDVSRSVKVTDVGATHVHFANTGDSKAVIMDVVGTEVTIPNFLLQTGKQLCVYAVANGVTVERKVFPVRKRERPENYVYDDDQRNYIYKVIEDAESATAEAERVADELRAARDSGEFNGPQGEPGPQGIPGETAELDKTLSIEGMAADAKAVGDLIMPIVVTEETGGEISAEVTSGFYNANSGNYSANNGYKAMKFPYNGTDKIRVTTYILANALAVACFYDENDTFIRSSGIETETKWFTDYELEIPEGTAYIAINCRHTGTENPSAYIEAGKRVYVNPEKVLTYKETVEALSAVTGKGYDSEKISAEIASGFYRWNTGVLTATSGYKAMKFAYDGTSRIIATTYVMANTLAVACFYDSADAFISSTGLETETKWITDYELPIPPNTAYIAINCRYTGTEEPSAYKVTSEGVYPDYSKMLHGKKIVNFGDSIFGNYRDTNNTDKSISAYIAEKTGAKVYNAGFGGCRMATHSQYWDAFSMDSLADAIVTGNWTPQETAIANQSALPTYFSDTVEMLKGIDWNNIDVITIGYGTNDYTGNVALADFKESLRYSLRTILTAYPHLQIIVVSPMWRWFIVSGAYSHCSDDEASKNSNGNILPDFVVACEEVAKEYHVPYLDTYYDMGINRYNYLHYFASSDGTHPMNNGREMRARYISNKLLQILGH